MSLQLAIPGNSNLVVASGERKETTGGAGIVDVDNHLLLLTGGKCAAAWTESRKRAIT